MWIEKKLDDVLTEPTLAAVEDIKRIDGGILVLGIDGKMRHTIYVLANRATERAGIHKKAIAVSRFHDPEVGKYLKKNHVEMTQADLQDLKQLENLPEVPNVIYMAERKFGTDGQEWITWGVNSALSALVEEKYKKSRIVVFLFGNICPMIPLASSGCTEKDKVVPAGEYIQSCLAGERTFEYYSSRYGIKVSVYRLNSTMDLGYGILAGIADKIMNQTPISVTTSCFNYVWQDSAAKIGVRGLLHTSDPPRIMNVTGLEAISVGEAVEKVGGFLDREPIFGREEGNDAYLNNASQATKQFGYPTVSAGTLIRRQAGWVAGGGRSLGLPTHFGEREGCY